MYHLKWALMFLTWIVVDLRRSILPWYLQWLPSVGQCLDTIILQPGNFNNYHVTISSRQRLIKGRCVSGRPHCPVIASRGAICMLRLNPTRYSAWWVGLNGHICGNHMVSNMIIKYPNGPQGPENGKSLWLKQLSKSWYLAYVQDCSLYVSTSLGTIINS